jgi:hypothetical protein
MLEKKLKFETEMLCWPSQEYALEVYSRPIFVKKLLKKINQILSERVNFKNFKIIFFKKVPEKLLKKILRKCHEF